MTTIKAEIIINGEFEEETPHDVLEKLSVSTHILSPTKLNGIIISTNDHYYIKLKGNDVLEVHTLLDHL